MYVTLHPTRFWVKHCSRKLQYTYDFTSRSFGTLVPMPKSELWNHTIKCSHAFRHWLWLCVLTLIICPASIATTLLQQFTCPWYRIQYYSYDLETDKLQINLRNKSWPFLKLLFLKNCYEIVLYTLRPNQEIRKEIEIVWFLIEKVSIWKASS